MTLYERDQRNIAKGREEGRIQQMSNTITQALKREKAFSEIADFLGMTEEDIRKFCSENEITI